MANLHDAFGALTGKLCTLRDAVKPRGGVGRANHGAGSVLWAFHMNDLQALGPPGMLTVPRPNDAPEQQVEGGFAWSPRELETSLATRPTA